MQNKHKFLARFISILMSLAISIYSIPAAFAAELDSTPPSDVEGIEAQSMDGAVKLTWEASTDDTGVIGYRINYGLDSVTEDGGEYMFVEEVDDSVETIIDGLDNDVTYYFALTALDAAGNESEFYSVEVSATPEADASSDEASNVEETEDLNSEEDSEETMEIAEEEDMEETLEEEENTDSEIMEEEVVEEETMELADVVAPLLADLAAKIENEKNVRLSWSIEEGLENLSDQILYQSEDGGQNYAEGQSLGKSVRDYLVANLVPGKTYTFKLTAKDMEGKEGDGLVTSITLPETGAGLTALIAMSFGIAGLVSRKRK